MTTYNKQMLMPLIIHGSWQCFHLPNQSELFRTQPYQLCIASHPGSAHSLHCNQQHNCWILIPGPALWHHNKMTPQWYLRENLGQQMSIQVICWGILSQVYTHSDDNDDQILMRIHFTWVKVGKSGWTEYILLNFNLHFL